MTAILIQAHELHGKTGDPKVLVVDTRDREDYEESHIPAAVHCDLYVYHWADTSATALRAFLRHMAKVFANIGVSNEKNVVFYEENSGMRAARGLWLLETLGHDSVSIVDGGFNAWLQGGYETEHGTRENKPAKFRPRIRANLAASASYILKRLKTRRLQVVDSRSSSEYLGKVVRGARGGHIPNAINVDWVRNLDPQGKFLPPDKLKELYEKTGVSPNRQTVTYCQGGFRAAHTYVALRLIGGKKVKVYPGSWFEWGNNVALPVES